MVRELVVGVAMLRAENASSARVASRRAIGLDFDAMRQAARDVPARFDAHGAGWARRNTTAHGASRAWVEAERVAGRIDRLVEQQRGAKCDPGTVDRMHRDAENARARDTRDLAQL